MAGATTLFFLGAALNADSFYIPFWFQAVQGVDAMTSGVRLIPLFIPQMVSLIAVGALVSKWGYYVRTLAKSSRDVVNACPQVPYMILGEAIAIAGSILLTRLSPISSTLYWDASLACTGLGMGMAMQLPYTAVQVVLSQEDVATGNAIAVFSWQFGGSVAIAAGQTITLNTILGRVPMESQQKATSAIAAALQEPATASAEADQSKTP
ncbi:MAG: hypothetical protein Q9226_008201 [Calogaya cf. arnoldii]